MSIDNMIWQDYEETVRKIYETIGKEYGVKVKCYGNNCKVKGKSEVEHQIDVLTSHTDGLHSYLTAIECKYWNEKVNKDIVMKVLAIIDDCNIDKGVIVSRKGFTHDAQKFAKSSNVQLVELREYNFLGTVEEITKYYVHVEIIKPILIGVKFVFENNILNSVRDAGFTDNVFDSFYEFPDGTQRNNKSLIADFLNKKVLNEGNLKIVKEKISFPVGTEIKKTGCELSFPIVSVNFEGTNEWLTMLDVDFFENKVWLVMKVLFENKEFIVTKNYEILHRRTNKIEMNPNRVGFIIAHFFSRNLRTGELKPLKVGKKKN